MNRGNLKAQPAIGNEFVIGGAQGDEQKADVLLAMGSAGTVGARGGPASTVASNVDPILRCARRMSLNYRTTHPADLIAVRTLWSRQ